MERRDFFVSYNKDNKAWAEWIVRVLNDKGYSTYSQFDIKPGEIFLTKMNDFLENSANFIAVWSEGYSNSWYCMREMEAAFKACHEGRMGCLLPVLIDRFPVKLLYSALVHVELPDRGAASKAALADAVRHAVPRPLSVQDEERVAEGWRLYTLGDDYYEGHGVAQDYAKARDCWEQAAAKGNARALNDLGWLYDNGLGITRNYAKARDYYEQAVAKGNVPALSKLGYLYENGLGVTQDYAKARDYYERAAVKGNAEALNNLGTLYDKGLGVAQDYAKARDYYERAAKGDKTAPYYNLGLMYEYGHGVDVDYETALDYYQKAADAGSKGAPAKVKAMREKLNR